MTRGGIGARGRTGTAGETGGRREVGMRGRRGVTMGGEKVIIGVSDDAGSNIGGNPSIVGKIAGGLVTTGATDGGTARGKDGAVGGGMPNDAGDVTEEGPPSIGKDETQSLTTVVTDDGTSGAKNGAVAEDKVSCDAESVDGDDPSSTGGHSAAVVTDIGTVGGKDGVVSVNDVGSVTGNVPAGLGDDAGLSVPAEDPLISN